MFTAPTALRAIRKADPDGALLEGRDLSSLRALFVAGERADPDTVAHFERLLGVPVVDHWWQTESGSPMCGMQFEDVGTRLGSCGLPLPGFDIQVLDEAGAELGPDEMGSVAIKLPLPPGFMTTLRGAVSVSWRVAATPRADCGDVAATRIVRGQIAAATRPRRGSSARLRYENDERFVESYLDEFPGYYSAGDAGFRDADGYLHVMTRTDDVARPCRRCPAPAAAPRLVCGRSTWHLRRRRD